jgi:hypothetical protein
VAVAGALLAGFGFRRSAVGAPDGEVKWVVDVPLVMESSDFQLKDGSVTDTMVDGAALARADFFEHSQNGLRKR